MGCLRFSVPLHGQRAVPGVRGLVHGVFLSPSPGAEVALSFHAYATPSAHRSSCSGWCRHRAAPRAPSHACCRRERSASLVDARRSRRDVLSVRVRTPRGADSRARPQGTPRDGMPSSIPSTPRSVVLVVSATLTPEAATRLIVGARHCPTAATDRLLLLAVGLVGVHWSNSAQQQSCGAGRVHRRVCTSSGRRSPRFACWRRMLFTDPWSRRRPGSVLCASSTRRRARRPLVPGGQRPHLHASRA